MEFSRKLLLDIYLNYITNNQPEEYDIWLIHFKSQEDEDTYVGNGNHDTYLYSINIIRFLLKLKE